jgi:hypothetical protein
MRNKQLHLADTALPFTPQLEPRHEKFLSRTELATRWGCSEKAVLRAEPRLGLEPHRLLRAIKYRLSNILRIEAESRARLPKKFVGLRPDQKAELLRREREELSKQASIEKQLAQTHKRRVGESLP